MKRSVTIDVETREEAAALCSAAASNPGARYIFESLGYGGATIALVQAAYSQVPRCECREHSDGDDGGYCRFEWAEAEALLQCGWSP